ncbi:hypothetical protein GCM10018962_80820 [Dactylosporangium matsuzakiense]|uniref:Uncharacterized protein n=1 Tax=Dactylosporangium matsuzakiense TaxID=53360 RepID=A0A9W6KI75_9ACTN|nr:hypothetical protein GCM10017581_031730 [Dactylosporangium matsuzakiense]
MTVVGITGHQNIPATAIPFIRSRIRAVLEAQQPPPAGVGSLAVGADQLFATIIGELGAPFHAVVPCAGYESTLSPPDALRYHELLAAAASTEQLPFPAPSEEAFMATGIRVVERCSLLIAVWDGRPAGGLGGTADVVHHAQTLGRPVHVIWPAGVRRG